MEENKNVSAEELAAEQAALAIGKEDEIRSKVIAEFGFDEVDDVERIDKLVAKEIEHSKKMSQAIGQKIKWRTEATKVAPPVVTPPVEKKVNDQGIDVKKLLSEELEKRDLEALEYSPEIKKEIQRIAEITQVSVKQALKDPYIVAKIKDINDAIDAEGAAITRNNRSGGNKKSLSLDNVPDVDMSTPEGRLKYDKWKEEMIKKGH